MAAASGAAATTAQEFIRRAKAGYYEGMKTFHDKQAHRAWRRKFKQDMRGWKREFRREVHENASQWQQNWQQHWAQHPPPFGLHAALPLVTLLRVLVGLAGLAAVVSLVSTGAVFGVALPDGMPLWVGLLVLLVLWRLVTWPLRAFRYACYAHGVGRWGRPVVMGGCGDSVFGLVFLVVAVWVADRYVPGVHEGLKQLPPLLHRAVDALQGWLGSR
jgi:hypothetical protein